MPKIKDCMKKTGTGYFTLLGMFLISMPVIVVFLYNYTDSLLFEGDFETGNLSQFPPTEWEPQHCCSHSHRVVTSPVRSGNFALRTELRKTDPPYKSHRANSHRAEFAEKKRYPLPFERWYGFSVYLPNDWVDDVAPEILVQWHDVPDAGEGPAGGPPFYIATLRGNWIVINHWDPAPIKIKKDLSPEGGVEELWTGAYEKEKWTDWVIHAKWSYQVDGLLEIWKDGTKIVTKSGPNTLNDQMGPYFKFGVYKWWWTIPNRPSDTTIRVMYHDEIRFAGAQGNFCQVDPNRCNKISSL